MNNVRSSQDVEDAVSSYDYTNRRDAENFCPVVSQESDSDYDDPNDPGMTFNAFGDQTEFMSQPEPNNLVGQFSGDNLVAAPNMVSHLLVSYLQPTWLHSPPFSLQVAKIQINYARVAKKMDMRRLKSTMWTMLNTNPPAQVKFRQQALTICLFVWKTRKRLSKARNLAFICRTKRIRHHHKMANPSQRRTAPSRLFCRRKWLKI